MTPLRSFLKCRLVSGSLIIVIPRAHRDAIGLERGDRVLVETNVETGVVTVVSEKRLFGWDKATGDYTTVVTVSDTEKE